MGSGVTGKGQRNHRKNNRIEPFRQTTMQFSLIAQWSRLQNWIVRVWVEQIVKRAIFSIDDEIVSSRGKVAEIEGIGLELDDRNGAVRSIGTLNFAVFHQQHVSRWRAGDVAIGGIINQVKRRVAGIGNE